MDSIKNTLINRFDDPILSEYYPQILDCCPEYAELREIVAKLVQDIHVPGERILDIGAGRGDSTKPILATIDDVTVDVLDISPELLGEASELLEAYAGRYQIILEDALVYLDRCEPYRTMHSAFTVHNFYQADKEKLLRAVFDKLESGGSLILLDKVQPNDADLERKYFEFQVARYRTRLEPKVADAIIAHEIEDLKDGIRMQETQTIDLLKSFGFTDVCLVQRINRDVVIRAQR